MSPDSPSLAQSPPDPLDTVRARLDEIRARGLWRSPAPVESPPGPWITIDGRGYLHLCSNNYLNLSTAPEVIEAAREAAARWGLGAGAARLVTGDLPPARQLERELADFKAAEAALVFPSGYLANLAAVAGLTRAGDWLVCDTLNHASLIDAARLSRAEVRVYAHGDAAEAERLLALAPPGALKAIVTDGVFSMDGDIATLASLSRAALAHNAFLIVDDAHGAGVIGPEGRGSCAEAGVAGDHIIHVTTLSKALGVQGGAVAAARPVIDLLINRARAFIFETAPSPVLLGAASAALRLARTDHARRRRLLDNAAFLRARLAELGVPTPVGVTPIIPVILGSNDAAVSMQAALRERGHWVTAIRPPTVPEGQARLRITVMADHAREDLDRFATDLAALLAPALRRA